MSQTHLNTELLSGEARGRKHVPVAVFAVIFIHIVLFLVLLIAAGCRARARAQEKARQAPGVAAVQTLEPGAALASESAEAEIGPEPEIATEETEAVSAPASAARAAAASERDAGGVYVVRPGDNLGAIAREHGTTVRAIKELNGLKSDFIRAGQKLRVESSTRESPNGNA